MKHWLACIVVLIAHPALPGTEASFDCAKAKAKIEKLICSDDGLARLDVKLAGAYQVALRAGRIEKALQLDWIRHNEDCVKADAPAPVQCLYERFSKRIADLEGTSIWPARSAEQISWQRPSFAESRDVCSYVATRGPGIAAELIKRGVLGSKPNKSLEP